MADGDALMAGPALPLAVEPQQVERRGEFGLEDGRRGRGFLMERRFSARNHSDADGLPCGGDVLGSGLNIEWQNGPLGRVGSAFRDKPMGAFVEDVIAAALQRIEFYQTVAGGRFACDENADALSHLQAALDALEARTKRRTEEGTEGTHEGK